MEYQTSQKWNRVKLGDVAKISRGSSPRPIADKKYFIGGDIPWIKIADATKSGKYLYKTKEYVNAYGASFSRLLPKGSLIVAASGTLGYTQLLGVEGCAHDGWLIVDTDDTELDKNFLYYKLIEQQRYFYNSAYGAAIQNVNTGILKQLDLDLPDLTLQKQIAAILSAYDDLIENNNSRIKSLEEIAQKIYSEWFINFRFPGHKKGRTEVSGLPEGWKEMKLDDCISIYRGKSYSSEDLSESEESVPFVNLKCIKRFGGFRKNGIKSFSGTYKEHQKVQQGDIVMAVTDMTQERMIVARPARISHLGADFGVISMDLIKIEPKERCEKDFLYAYFRWSDFADNVKNYANGANVLHLTPNRITDYKFICPPIAFQKKYSELVVSLFDEIDRLQLVNENLQRTRDQLIPQLVTGKLEVKV